MSGQTDLLAGKVAIVTGASRGIGASTARALAAAGAAVALAARRLGRQSLVPELVPLSAHLSAPERTEAGRKPRFRTERDLV
jgi:NAD(P)-dependent dehydrogenase (short-subunit alcohol dehydrogenase family)